MYAVANNHPQCVELLLQAGADITAESESGHNALALAIAKGHVKGMNTVVNDWIIIVNQHQLW